MLQSLPLWSTYHVQSVGKYIGITEQIAECEYGRTVAVHVTTSAVAVSEIKVSVKQK